MSCCIDSEKRIVEKMIRIYCKNKHTEKSICSECLNLLNYAHLKLDKCKYQKNKPSCKKCITHCYKVEERNKIKNVMRFAGPRILWQHPIATIKHLLK